MRRFFSKGAPCPHESVELIYSRVRAHWGYHAWTVALAALIVFVIPTIARGPRMLPRLGAWLHRLIDYHSPSWLLTVPAILGVTILSICLHEATHLTAATFVGRVRARFSLFGLNPAVYWIGSMSRNEAIAVLVLPCVIWGIVPLTLLAHLPSFEALLLYVLASQNLIGSRTDIAQALFMVRFLPVGARIYCHPDGLAFAHASDARA